VTTEPKDERKQALPSGDERFHMLVEGVKDYAICMLDRHGHVATWNSGAEQIQGYTVEEIIGRHISCFYSPEHVEQGRPERQLQTAIREGRCEEEGWRVRKDGSRFWANTIITALRDGDGQVEGFAQITRDLTRRKRAEEALRASEERLRALTQSANVAIISADATGTIVTWNHGAEVIFGYAEDEILARPLTILMPDSYREPHRQGLARYYSTGVSRLVGKTVELRGLRKDGSEFPIELSLASWETAQGKYFSGIIRDITERKNAEEAIRTSEQRFRTMMETIPTFVAIFQGTGHVYVNPAAETMLGYTREELLRCTFLDYVHPDHHKLVKQRSLARQRGEPVPPRYEVKIVTKSGRELWVDFSAAVIEYEGQPAVLGIAIDVTRRKELHEARRIAMEAAESVSRAKSTFLANMSHEIRTPMNAVIGMTELLLETPLDRMQREYLNIVKDSSESLLSLINDILDFSKIEAGKLELTRTPFQIRELLGDTMKALSLRTKGRDIEVACHVETAVPDVLEGDPLRLRQIVTNLVGNAIKFTDRGEVILDVAMESSHEGSVQLHISVRDTGIGIPAEKQQSIFESFSQVDASMTRRFGGTGLGLAIASRLVELMNGKIWVESELGRGSCFHFTAEMHRGKTIQPVPAASAATLVGLRVLIVDDNQTNRLILQEMLDNWAMRPTAVADADAAMSELDRARQSGAPFDVLLTDVHMPGTDGFQLTERVKASSELDGTIILMLTSSDGPRDIERCRQLGGAAYLIKPIKQSELFDAIVASLGTIESIEPATAPGTQLASPTMRPLRILLAEDSYANQRLAVGLLTKWGHQVTVANNGREAVAAVESGNFDLVLMDVQMPEMDGHQAAAAIREREQRLGGHLPIVAMTAHAMKGDREECLAAGMDGYVAKPIRRRELEQAVAEVVDIKHPRPTPIERAADSVAPMTSLDSQNWEQALRTVEGDRDMLRDILPALIDETSAALIRLRLALQEQSAQHVAQAAHSLKGTLKIFGRTETGDLAERLEALGKTGNLVGGDELLASLQPKLNALLDDVRAWLAEQSR
jgi:PAS domain S-box-containing protein